MTHQETLNLHKLSRLVGWSLIASIVVGIGSAIFIASGIDINLSADIVGTAQNMLGAEERLQAKAYVGLFTFMLSLFTSAGLFIILKRSGLALSLWSLLLAVSAGILTLFGSVYAMNAALIAGNDAFKTLADENQRVLLASLQASADYTSFHLSLVLSSLANAGFFYLFFRSRLIPLVISSWGVFASLFVAITIIARDFILLLGNGGVTSAFMLSNLIALIALGVYLAVQGVRS